VRMVDVDPQTAQSIRRNWPRPTGRRACGRDPYAGPGSCSLWWEGCPKAEDRGCYQAYVRRELAGRGLAV
jgi:hypothetical protein